MHIVIILNVYWQRARGEKDGQKRLKFIVFSKVNCLINNENVIILIRIRPAVERERERKRERGTERQGQREYLGVPWRERQTEIKERRIDLFRISPMGMTIIMLHIITFSYNYYPLSIRLYSKYPNPFHASSLFNINILFPYSVTPPASFPA